MSNPTTMTSFATRLVAYWNFICPYLTFALQATKAFALTFWAKFINIAANPITTWATIMESEWGTVIRYLSSTSVTVFTWLWPRFVKAADTVIVPAMVTFFIFCKDQIAACVKRHTGSETSTEQVLEKEEKDEPVEEDA